MKYLLTVAEKGSITEAAKGLFISQPSLSNAIKEVEKEIGFSIFTRSRTGIALTKEGMEFLGYARQVVQQMDLLESKYVFNVPVKQRFCVSTQHYTFTANAFVEMVQQFGQERFEFILNEHRSEVERIDFDHHFSKIITLIPLDVAIKETISAAIDECNQYGDFVLPNFIITNVKKLSTEEIVDLLNNNDIEETDDDDIDDFDIENLED